MKKTNTLTVKNIHTWIGMILIVALSFITTGCEDDDDDDDNEPDNTTEQRDEVRTNLLNGPWEITNYSNDGIDSSAFYAAYTLSFESVGNVSATFDSLTSTGTWFIEIESNNQLELVMNFANDTSLKTLDEDWMIMNYTTTSVNLQNLGGGNILDKTMILDKRP